MAKNKPVISDLEAIAMRFEKSIQTALLDLFTNIRDEFTLKQIRILLESGGVSNVLQLYESITPQMVEYKLLTTLQQAIAESGRISLMALPTGAVINAMAFNLLYPKTIQSINNYAGNFISGVSNSILESVRESLRANIIAGNNPNITAREIKEMIGLSSRQIIAVRNFRTALETKDQNKLKSILRDDTMIVRDRRFDPHIKRMLQGEEIPKEKIDQIVSRYIERSVQSRSRIIARTESIRAVSWGI